MKPNEITEMKFTLSEQTERRMLGSQRFTLEMLALRRKLKLEVTEMFEAMVEVNVVYILQIWMYVLTKKVRESIWKIWFGKGSLVGKINILFCVCCLPFQRWCGKCCKRIQWS